MKTIGATEFKARCLRVIGQMNKDRESVTITNRGRPVAVLSPLLATNEQSSIIGAMRGSVLAYDDPFGPALDPSDWAADRFIVSTARYCDAPLVTADRAILAYAADGHIRTVDAGV